MAPIGWHWQWHSITQIAHKCPFPPTLSAAHPQFDSQTNEMFTVNGCKSLSGLFPLSDIFQFHAHRFQRRYLEYGGVKTLATSIIQQLNKVIEWLEGAISALEIGGKDAVYINRWTGVGTGINQWQVMQSNGRPMKIRQSLHQMALTKNYAILSDSAFKLHFTGLIPSLSCKSSDFNKYIDQILAIFKKPLNVPEHPYTDIYFIPRAGLRSDVDIVTTKQVRIYPETAHFIADYDDEEGKVTLHVGHTAASDPAEFVLGVDRAVYNNFQVKNHLKERAGLTVSPMDASRLGCWVIDVENETATPPAFLPECDSRRNLWSLSLYTGHEFQPLQITDLYWNCWGAWPELYSQSAFDLYEYYPNRIVSVPEIVNKIIKYGKPANLLRLHIDRSESTDRPKLTLEDCYNFPPGYFGNSPQFVPRAGSKDPTDGYCSVVLFSDNLLSDNNELWIFDAKNLSAGPRYRLSHPQLNIGVTIHTTWLSKLETPPIREDYSVRKDYQDAVNKTRSQAIKTLFEQDVYPHFES